MLPKLRIILAAVFATCAAVLALSAGMLGTRPRATNSAGVPEISRTLVRQAIVAEPDRQQFRLLAYSRRADELLRLRDLPVTPARAVVDYAEQGPGQSGRDGERPRGAGRDVADGFRDGARSGCEQLGTRRGGQCADGGRGCAGFFAANTYAAHQLAPAGRGRNGGGRQPAWRHDGRDPGGPACEPAARVRRHHGPGRGPATTPPRLPPPSRRRPPPLLRPQQAATPGSPPFQTGDSETAEMYGPRKPKADAKPRHRAKVAHPHPSKPKKKTQVVVGNPRAAPTTSTGVPVSEPNNRNAVNQPNNRNNGFGGWRYDSTAR